MISSDIVDLRLHYRKTDHCVNIDSPADKTLRDISDFLRQYIGFSNEDYIYFQGNTELSPITRLSDLLRPREKILELEFMDAKSFPNQKKSKRCGCL